MREETNAVAQFAPADETADGSAPKPAVGSGQKAEGRAEAKCNGTGLSDAEDYVRERHVVGMQPFRRLKVWHKAFALSVACHHATFRRPPGGGAPGFRSQLLRAVDSIMDNIAEGAGQQSQRQFARFLENAIPLTR